jgi:hypothetical protein
MAPKRHSCQSGERCAGMFGTILRIKDRDGRQQTADFVILLSWKVKKTADDKNNNMRFLGKNSRLATFNLLLFFITAN